MKYPSLAVLAAAMLLAGARAPAAPAAHYKLIDLGQALPVGINQRGEIAANSITSGRAEVSRNNAWTILPGRLETQAYALNLAGDVAGMSVDWSGGMRAAWWPRGGGLHLVPALPNAFSGWATAIADDGTVVGTYFDMATAQQRSFVYTEAGGTVDLGDFGTSEWSYPYAINNHGQVVGGYEVDAQYDSHSFLWQAGVFQDLGALPGSNWNSMRAINDAGHAVGQSTVDSTLHATLWDGTRLVDLGTTESGAMANAINGHDDIVGAGSDPVRLLHGWAAYFGTDGTTIDLETRVVNLNGWQLWEAVGIDDAGVIIGHGLLNHVERAFMLVPQD